MDREKDKAATTEMVRDDLMAIMKGDLSFYGYLHGLDHYFREAVRIFWDMRIKAVSSGDETEYDGPVREIAERIADCCGRRIRESMEMFYPSYEVPFDNAVFLIASRDASTTGKMRLIMISHGVTEFPAATVGLRFIDSLCTALMPELDRALPALFEVVKECQLRIKAEKMADIIRKTACTIRKQ